MVDYWNHNVAYHPLILGAVPAGCSTALDLGCGDGLLARKLAARVGHVTGIDRSREMIEVARRLSGGIDNISFVEADFRTHDFRTDEMPGGGFGFICAVATVHHMEFAPAVGRMAELLRTGGRLVLVGLARNRTPLDWAISAIGVPMHQTHRLLGGERPNPHLPPLMDPEMSWGQIRLESRRLLPGSRYRRHLLWRYSVVWTKP